MATIQQLEKLYQLLRLFENGDSLEATVATERINRLIAKTEKLIHQGAFLRDERRRLRQSIEFLDERKRGQTVMQRQDFLPKGLPDLIQDRHILLNIGGLMFEAPVQVLKRDKNSLLAQLTDNNPPLLPDPEGGFFYFDRDWWLFRYILSFLRDGSLPEDRQLLSQLYREAAFWQLTDLQHAIEDDKLHLRTKAMTKDEEALCWWKQQPSWWKALDEAERAEKAATEKSKQKVEDWWTDTSYHGKSFLPLSSAMDKVTTKEGEKDAKPVPTMTWAVPSKASSTYPYSNDILQS